MTKLLKTFMAFMLSSLLILSISMPSKGILEIDNRNYNETLSLEYASSFYDSNKNSQKILEPVVKLNFAVQTPSGEVVISSATGFSVAYDKRKGISYVITNDHFCEDLAKAILPARIFFEDSTNQMSAEKQFDKGNLFVVETDPRTDLCLLRTHHYIKPVKLAAIDYQVKQLDSVITVGAPNGVFPIITESNVGNLFDRDILPDNMKHGDHLIMISDIIFGGQSGSPLYNKNGEVIGVMFMGLNNQFGPVYGSLAIPISDVYKIMKRNSL